MLSMVRAQLFRMVHSRFAIAYAVVLFLVVFTTPLALWLDRVWPAFAALGFVVVPDEPLPSLRISGVSLLSGSFLTMGVGIAAGYYAAGDFKSGFVKNLVQVRGGRLSYAVALVVCVLVLAVVSTAAGVLIVEGGLRLQGYIPAAPSLGEALQWFTQVVLCIAAYAALTVFLAVVFRSDTVAVLGSVLLGGGAVEGVVQMVLANIPGLPAALRDCLDGYLAADLGLLSQGVVCDPMTYVQAGATILVAAAACVLVMRRKSLA